MQRIPRHRLLAAVLTFLSLMAIALLPIGGFANAAPASTKCPSGEGTECFLVILAPTSVVVGQPFTVDVAVTTDGTTVAKGDSCGKSVRVTLALYESNGEGWNFVTSFAANAKAGIATFSVNVSVADLYELRAYVGEGDGCAGYFFVPADPVDFMAIVVPPGQPIEPCPPDTSCVQVTSGSGTAATLFADSGTFFDVFFLPRQDLCGDGGPVDPNGVLSFNYVGGDPKIVVIWLKDATKPAGHYKICWQSPNLFTPLGGGAMVNVGYLPKCEKKEHAVAPCVLDADNGKHHSASFEILAPPGDPQVYPE